MNQESLGQSDPVDMAIKETASFSPAGEKLASCYCCGLVQRVPTDPADRSYCCFRCDRRFALDRDRTSMRVRVSALALAALALFPAAVLLPIVQIERLGMQKTSSLMGGVQDLWESGGSNSAIAVLLFLFSFVFPLTKLIAILEISLVRFLKRSHKATLFRIVENLGKWSMLDVVLLALMVMWVKLNDLVSFQFGPAVFAFAGCVTLSMFASLAFNPHAIWEQA